MDTYFAPAQRSSPEGLQSELEIISRNPVIDGLLKAVSGLLAVLDEHRQILTVNDSLCQMLGLANARDVLGLRPGEAIACIHAQEAPAGCGTTKHCVSCGAAIAIVSSLANDRPEERICAATVKRNGGTIDICFQVRSVPIRFEERQFILLFLQDITRQQNLAAIEKIFFHDINNLACCLVGATELFPHSKDLNKLNEIIALSARRLKSEIDIQKALFNSKNPGYQLSLRRLKIADIFGELQGVMDNHPAAQNKHLTISPPLSRRDILTDLSLVLRILTNMLTNAFEATANGGEVKLWADLGPEQISFCVWNDQAIPEDLRLRIFQRNFTTKPGPGRGLGTYSMKLLGEDIMKGKIDFTSTPSEGTIFRLTITGVSALPY